MLQTLGLERVVQRVEFNDNRSMIVAILGLVIVNLIFRFFIFSLFLFIRRSPTTTRKRGLLLYNVAVILAAISWSCVDSWLLRSKMGVDIGWWWVVAFIRGSSIIVTVLLIMGLTRNLLVFQK